MTELKSKTKFRLKIFRYVLIILFTTGFIYQTLQFLLLYWTYPTVVDIQQSSPTYIEMPAFTFCNRNGYFYENICEKYNTRCCLAPAFRNSVSDVLCKTYPAACTNGTLPEGFKTVLYRKFMEKYSIKREDFKDISVPLEKYLNCTIEFAGNITECNMENVVGSFYTLEDLPQFCYSIYSLWGKPNKKRELIPKGATVKFSMYLGVMDENGSPLPVDENGDGTIPLYNPPCASSVQVAVHSPYFLPSPYLSGSAFLGGRAYELRIKSSESHLLPLPYQTNCTDYMTGWKQRGGKAPINQLSIIQECRINKTYEALGCIPATMDYPHAYNICRLCGVYETTCNLDEPPNNCSLLAENYNQPCDSITYIVDKEDKAITINRQVKSIFASNSDRIRVVQPMHDCEGKKVWGRDCVSVSIDVPFDQFEITNITYNPKFESLELFSVIGGYMGMWLGISLLAIYDILFDAMVSLRSYLAQKKKKKTQAKSMKKKMAEQKTRSVVTRNSRYDPHYVAW